MTGEGHADTGETGELVRAAESVRAASAPIRIFDGGLENLKDIHTVALVLRWKDGTVTAGWPNTGNKGNRH